MFLRWVWMLQSKSWAVSVRQVKCFLSWLISTDPYNIQKVWVSRASWSSEWPGTKGEFAGETFEQSQIWTGCRNSCHRFCFAQFCWEVFCFEFFCMVTNQHASTWCPVEQLGFEFVCMIFSNMDLQRFLFWRTVSQWSQATREASGNIWAPTIIFSNSPLSDQTIVDQQVAENYIWIILDFKAALTVERKAAAIPAPPEEAVEVVDWNFFFQGWSYHRWIYFIYLIIQVAYYSGAENPVTYTRNFKNTFACVFDLKKYPFDTQVHWYQTQGFLSNSNICLC